MLRDYQKGESGKGLRAAAKLHGVPHATLRGWVRQEAEIKWHQKQTTQDGAPKFKKRLSGGGRKAAHPEVETKCVEWVGEMNEKGIGVTGTQLRSKAESFARDLHIEGFKTSPRWLCLFKGRHSLVLQREKTYRKLPDVAS